MRRKRRMGRNLRGSLLVQESLHAGGQAGEGLLQILDVDLKNVPVEVEPAHPGSSEFWTKLFVSVVLVLAGGVFAG